jgi:hypothetical protein
MRKIVYVFIHDRLRAAYPVVLAKLDRPSDEDFVEVIRKRKGRRGFMRTEWKNARFIVRR